MNKEVNKYLSVDMSTSFSSVINHLILINPIVYSVLFSDRQRINNCFHSLECYTHYH